MSPRTALENMSLPSRLVGLAALVSAVAVIGAVAVAGSDEVAHRKQTDANVAATQKTVAGLVVWADKTQQRGEKVDRNQKLYTWCASQSPPVKRADCPVEK